MLLKDIGCFCYYPMCDSYRLAYHYYSYLFFYFLLYVCWNLDLELTQTAANGISVLTPGCLWQSWDISNLFVLTAGGLRLQLGHFYFVFKWEMVNEQQTAELTLCLSVTLTSLLIAESETAREKRNLAQTGQWQLGVFVWIVHVYNPINGTHVHRANGCVSESPFRQWLFHFVHTGSSEPKMEYPVHFPK